MKRCVVASVLLTWGVAGAGDVTANRRYGAWESCKIGGGGYLQDICWAPSDPNRIYVLSDVGGLFRSDNGGGCWRMMHGGLPAVAEAYSPRSLWIDPANPDLLVLATGTQWLSAPGAEACGGLYRSEDGGVTWGQVASGLCFEGDGHERRGGNVLCEGGDGLLYAAPLGACLQFSADRGKTWKKLPSPCFAASHLMVDRSNPRRIWVCSTTWVPKQESRRRMAQQAQVGFFVSEDGGQTWRKTGGSVWPVTFIQSPTEARVLYGLAGEKRASAQVLRSADGGETWQPFSDGLAPYPEKWSAKKDGIYTALFFAGDRLIVGGFGGNMYTWAGARWERIACDRLVEDGWWGATGEGKPLGAGHAGCALGDMAVCPRHPDVWAFTDWYAVYFTNDSGKTWRLSIDGIEMTVTHTVAQDTVSPERMHIGVADVGYFRSETAGLDWTWGSGIGNNTKMISPSPANKGRVYATGPVPYGWFANHVYVSDDSGVSWRRTPMKGLPNMTVRRCNTVVADPVDPERVWLCVSGPVCDERPEGGVYVSSDGGVSWSYLKGQVTSPGIFRSEIFQGNEELAVANDGSMAAISINSKRLYAVTKAGEKWRRYKLPNEAPPNAVVADPHERSRLYVAVRWGMGLYQTDDAGGTWKLICKGDVSHVAVNRFRKGTLAVVCDSQILLSRDGGETWIAAPPGLPYRHHRNVVGFAGDYVTVGTGGNGVFRIPVAAFTGEALKRGADAPVAFEAF